jgi:hypothetical protein
VALRLPMAVLLPLAGAVAVLPAGVPGAFRALLGQVVPPERLEAAFALDAVLVELVWVVGPAIASAIVSTAPAVLSGPAYQRWYAGWPSFTATKVPRQVAVTLPPAVRVPSMTALAPSMETGLASSRTTPSMGVGRSSLMA